MSRFLQLHLLTFVPPANLNRDDTGRPKSAMVGGTARLRISSQALKRAWRESDVFAAALDGHMGQRTQRLGEVIFSHLREKQMNEAGALKTARDIAGLFGKIKDEKDKNSTQIEQLAFISPEERTAALSLADRILAGEKFDPKTANLLQRADTAADIAMFGRMLASAPEFNREAAVQVAHAITTHRVTIEDDYYTAIDDLKTKDEDAGAGFLGEAGFGSGVFYLYLCINRTQLIANINGDKSLAATALGALTEAAVTVVPRGKQNSFAALSRAHFVLAERGDQQPRTLAGAFARAVPGDDLMTASVEQLNHFRAGMTIAYGQGCDSDYVMEVGGHGNLAELVAFARGEP